MASTPKRRKLRAALTRRAEATIGPGATPLDYVEHWVANGGLITELAASLQEEMGESLSRGFLSFIVQRMAPDATTRIAAARHSAERARSPIAWRGQCIDSVMTHVGSNAPVVPGAV